MTEYVCSLLPETGLPSFIDNEPAPVKLLKLDTTLRLLAPKLTPRSLSTPELEALCLTDSQKHDFAASLTKLSKKCTTCTLCGSLKSDVTPLTFRIFWKTDYLACTMQLERAHFLCVSCTTLSDLDSILSIILNADLHHESPLLDSLVSHFGQVNHLKDSQDPSRVLQQAVSAGFSLKVVAGNLNLEHLTPQGSAFAQDTDFSDLLRSIIPKSLKTSEKPASSEEGPKSKKAKTSGKVATPSSATSSKKKNSQQSKASEKPVVPEETPKNKKRKAGK
eukprot:TRINITY_DN913_c0_g1::TRINITY_DN913_c0_g1_i1::g.15953::m.15953 TRINITY_DN913_c0_g1::TRINITY_DN913_c0_g1_i1::g.15953  ORF type:complete len:277 (-),score=18.37,LIF_OSM/PF01291.12/0.083 TRINITY_DN913_c0_g1_i1:133-963(-)